MPIEMDCPNDDVTGNADGGGLPVAEGGGVLSPLSGAYLLIVLAEPISEKHKVKMLQKLRQGKNLASWAVVVAQLAEVDGSKPVICKI